MANDSALAARIRALLASRSDVEEKAMFGDQVFLVGGHIVVGVHGDGLLVKVGADRHGEALARGAQPWSMGHRTSRGMVEVPVTGLADPQALGSWVDWALRIAGPDSTGG